MSELPQVIQKQMDALDSAIPVIERAARIVEGAAPGTGTEVDRLASDIESKDGHCRGAKQRLMLRHKQ